MEIVGNYFLEGNTELKKLNLPNLQIVRNNFLSNNKELQELNLPNLKIGRRGLLSEHLRMILSEQDKKTK